MEGEECEFPKRLSKVEAWWGMREAGADREVREGKRDQGGSWAENGER